MRPIPSSRPARRTGGPTAPTVSAPTTSRGEAHDRRPSSLSLAAAVSRKRPCECPRHQLDALADRIRNRLENAGASLLVPADDLAAVLDDLTATTDRLIPPTERTAR